MGPKGGLRGVGPSKTPPRAQTWTFEGPGFNEKTPKRGKKERKFWREREKRAKFWAVLGRAVLGKGGPQEGRSWEEGKQKKNKNRKTRKEKEKQ